MTITSQDLAFLESEEMTDFPTGGGQATGNVVADGEMNNVFPDKYSLSLVYGNVSIRKVFAAVRTATDDIYGGARVFLTRAPQDENVFALLFSSGSYTDRRTQIQQYVESYLTQSVISRLRLFGTQQAGQSIVMFYTDVNVDLPEIGSVYYLSYEPHDVQTDGQYVRLLELVLNDVRQFVEAVGDKLMEFTRRVLIYQINTQLKRQFPGAEPTQFPDPSDTRVRDTVPNQIARYYGLSALKEAASEGAYSIKAEAIYTPIVPTAQSETPIVDQPGGPSAVSLVQTGTDELALSQYVNWSPGTTYTLFFQRAFMPASMTFVVGGTTYKMGPEYEIVTSTSALGTVRGTVNPVGGNLTITVTAPLAGTLTGSALPAVGVPMLSNSASLAITISNISSNYVFTLLPLPSPATIVVSYRTANRWYDIRDNGLGQLVGDGSGSVNYTTGSGIASLAHPPDAGSEVILSWGQSVPYRQVADLVVNPDVAVTGTVTLDPAEGFLPGSLTMTWVSGGVGRTATDDGVGGWTGDGTGWINYGKGQGIFLLRPEALADSDTVYTLDYQTAAAQQETAMTPAVGGHTATFTLANIPVAEGSVHISWMDNVITVGTDQGDQTANRTRMAHDDGAGNIVSKDPHASGTIGTINYATGEISITVESSYGYNYHVGWPSTEGGHNASVIISCTGCGWQFGTETSTFVAGSMAVQYSTNTTPLGTDSVEYSAPPLTVDLTPDRAEPLVAGSVRFGMGGHVYVDRNGALYRDISPTTGAGTLAGSIDYDDQVAYIDDYLGTDVAVTVYSALTTYHDTALVEIVFRTPGAPVRPGSFFIRAVASDTGDLLTATADTNGDIVGTDILGTIDVQIGVVKIRFGHDDGGTWVQRAVLANTIFFNCVLYVAIPLNPEILGLDPVRLPTDGKVPIFEAGDVAMIHESFTQAIIANPPAAGSTVTLGHEKVGKAYVVDGVGAKVLEGDDTYTVDHLAGTVTFADPLDLSDFVGPYSVVYRIQSEFLVLDAHLDGTLTMNKAIDRDYSTSAVISSELLIDDQQARTTLQFAQNTWTNTWSDTRIGDPPSQGAQFNSVLYPIGVTNLGTVTERWRLAFVTTTRVDVIGEYFGVVLENASILEDIQVPNPAAPGGYYFTVPHQGWGGNWIVGNQLRLNTQAANYPVDVLRCIQPGPPGAETDYITIELLGDAQ